MAGIPRGRCDAHFPDTAACVMTGATAVRAGDRNEDEMDNKVLIAVGGGAAGALLAVAAFSGVPGGVFLAYFAPLPLMLVGLSHGVGALGLAAAAGLVVCLGVGGVAGAAVYAALGALPSWLTVQSALRKRVDRASGQLTWRPIGQTIATLALVIGFTMAMLGLTSAGGEPIATTVREQLLASLGASLSEIDPEVLARLVDSIAPFFLGFSAGLWLLMIVVNGVLAENFAAARNWALRPRPRWSTFALPDWFAWPLVIAAVIGLIPGGDAQFLARNLVMVFAAGYLLQGLATIHTISHGRSGRFVLLVGVYVSLFLFLLIAAPVVAGIGMIDQWAEIRRRMANSRRDRS